MSLAPVRDAIRTAPLLLLAIACGAISSANFVFAQAPAEEGKDPAKARITFSPEGEAKFAEFVKKVAEAKRNLWDLRMKKEIAAVAKVTGLDAAGMKALAAPAQQAAEFCIEGWSAKFDEYFRRAFSRQSEQIVETLEQIIRERRKITPTPITLASTSSRPNTPPGRKACNAHSPPGRPPNGQRFRRNASACCAKRSANF